MSPEDFSLYAIITQRSESYDSAHLLRACLSMRDEFFLMPFPVRDRQIDDIFTFTSNSGTGPRDPPPH